jgi:hypothetical protein
MKQEDRAKKAVEMLAASVRVPLPPEGLKHAGRWPGVRPGPLLLAGALVLVVIVAGWALRKERAPGDDLTSRVVVEHLRLRGKPVPTQVVELPGTDTLLVMVAEETTDAAGPGSPDGALAVAHLIPRGRLNP